MCIVESAEKLPCGCDTDLLYTRAPLEHPRRLRRAQLERKASVGVGCQLLERTDETMTIATREGGFRKQYKIVTCPHPVDACRGRQTRTHASVLRETRAGPTGRPVKTADRNTSGGGGQGYGRDARVTTFSGVLKLVAFFSRIHAHNDRPIREIKTCCRPAISLALWNQNSLSLSVCL